MVEGIDGSGPATRIAPKLWQGGFPSDPTSLREAGFDVIVLCAQEIQPHNYEAARHLRGVEVICSPLDDHERGPSGEEARIAAAAAIEVLRALKKGKRVLTTCRMGRNRSGLVNALVLVGYIGVDGAKAAEMIKAYRPNALTNSSFVHFLSGVRTWATRRPLHNNSSRGGVQK